MPAFLIGEGCGFDQGDPDAAGILGRQGFSVVPVGAEKAHFHSGELCSILG